jgi:hypothetical protein
MSFFLDISTSIKVPECFRNFIDEDAHLSISEIGDVLCFLAEYESHSSNKKVVTLTSTSYYRAIFAFKGNYGINVYFLTEEYVFDCAFKMPNGCYLAETDSRLLKLLDTCIPELFDA